MARWQPAALKPDPDNKNVRPDEMTDYVETIGLPAVTRAGETADTMRRFVANGFPVIVEKGSGLTRIGADGTLRVRHPGSLARPAVAHVVISDRAVSGLLQRRALPGCDRSGRRDAGGCGRPRRHHYRRGLTCQALGGIEGAMADFKTAHECNANFEAAAEALTLLGVER